MFWNEPSLYGATFPHRDITPPVQNPFMGPVTPTWQHIPPFVPPMYGVQQPFFNVPPMHMNMPPMHMNVPPMQMNPMVYSQLVNPFVRPLDFPHTRFDMPLHSFYRPFV